MPNSGKLRYELAVWRSSDGKVVYHAQREKHAGTVLHDLAVTYGAWAPQGHDFAGLVACLASGGLGVWLHQLPSAVHQDKLNRQRDRRAATRRAKSGAQ